MRWRIVGLLMLLVIAGCGETSPGEEPSAPVSTQDAGKAERQAEAAQRRLERQREARRKAAAAARRAKARAAARRKAARAAAQAAARPEETPEDTCDSNYSGACLDPNSSDYDCEGGSGDGPDYTGEVTVVGDDHYDLDADGDGTACDT